MRRSIAILVVLMVAAACSGDDAASSTTTSSPTTTSRAAPATTGPALTTTTQPATTTTPAPAGSTTTSTTTTTTTIAPGPGVLALTRVAFEPVVYVTVTNIGNGPAELGSHWLCQRPSYVQLPAMVLEPGDTVAIGLGEAAPPDLVEYAAVIELGTVLGPVVKEDGEVGLYVNPFFDSPSALLDYVQWGAAGHGREGVAVLAGIWEEGTFVAIPPEATSISSSGTGGVGIDDWFPDLGG